MYEENISLLCLWCLTHQPFKGALISSDTPKDMEPMKSLRVVLSQSHTSTDRRRSLSNGFNLLHTNTHEKTHLQCSERVCLTLTDSQDEGLVPGGVERGADGAGLLFGLILGVWDEFELHIRVWQTIGIHGNQISGLTHWLKRKKLRRELKHFSNKNKQKQEKHQVWFGRLVWC